MTVQFVQRVMFLSALAKDHQRSEDDKHDEDGSRANGYTDGCSLA